MIGKIKEFCFAFSFGAVIYGLLEVVIRNRTHWTMLAAGGLTLLLIYVMVTRSGEGSTAVCCALSFVVMTAMEFTVGCVVNRLLGMRVWDYSGRRLNLMGQICPEFCLGWLMLSYPALRLCRFIYSRFGRE